MNPDVIFCFGWSRLLKKRLLTIPKHGVVGFHPAELPMNRGKTSIDLGLSFRFKKTASTFFIMDEGADTRKNFISKERLKYLMMMLKVYTKKSC